MICEIVDFINQWRNHKIKMTLTLNIFGHGERLHPTFRFTVLP